MELGSARLSPLAPVAKRREAIKATKKKTIIYNTIVQTGLSYFLLILLQQLKIPTKYKQPRKSLIVFKASKLLKPSVSIGLLKLISNQIFSKKRYNNIQTGKNHQIQAKLAYG